MLSAKVASWNTNWSHQPGRKPPGSGTRSLPTYNSLRSPKFPLLSALILRPEAVFLRCKLLSLTMSANNKARTQKESFTTFNSALGPFLLSPGSPQCVTVPSLSKTTTRPKAIRDRTARTALRENLTRGPQVTQPTEVRQDSSMWEIVVILVLGLHKDTEKGI